MERSGGHGFLAIAAREQTLDQGFKLTDAYAAVTEDRRFSLSVTNDPPPWVDYHGEVAP